MERSEFINVEGAIAELASETSQKHNWPNPNEFVNIYYPFTILYDLFNLREWKEEDRLEVFTANQVAAILATMDELDKVDRRHEHILDRNLFQEAMLADPEWPKVVAAAKRFYETSDSGPST
ncbi:MAG TPA: hypothetical protein VK171_07840 [Fimbriimonas sp.]|nr:hypothetical protein [Fimbriimonas sp.]